MLKLKTKMEDTDSVIDLDSFDFTTWTEENSLSQTVTDALVKEDFTSEQMLCLLDEAHVKELRVAHKISMGETLVLIQSINKLKGTVKREKDAPDEVIDLDSFDFTEWTSENNLSESAINALVKEGFNSEEMLKVLTKDYVEKIRDKHKLPIAESVMIIRSINKLNHDTDCDLFNFVKWATEHGLSKEARDALRSEDFDTDETLCMLDEPDIALIGNKFRLSLGMKKRILKGVTQLKTRKSSIEENDGRIPNQDVTPGSVMLHVWGPGTSQNAGNVPIPPCYSTPLESGHSKQGSLMTLPSVQQVDSVSKSNVQHNEKSSLFEQNDFNSGNKTIQNTKITEWTKEFMQKPKLLKCDQIQQGPCSTKEPKPSKALPFSERPTMKNPNGQNLHEFNCESTEDEIITSSDTESDIHANSFDSIRLREIEFVSPCGTTSKIAHISSSCSVKDLSPLSRKAVEKSMMEPISNTTSPYNVPKQVESVQPSAQAKTSQLEVCLSEDGNATECSESSQFYGSLNGGYSSPELSPIPVRLSPVILSPSKTVRYNDTTNEITSENEEATEKTTESDMMNDFSLIDVDDVFDMVDTSAFSKDSSIDDLDPDTEDDLDLDLGLSDLLSVNESCTDVTADTTDVKVDACDIKLDQLIIDENVRRIVQAKTPIIKLEKLNVKDVSSQEDKENKPKANIPQTPKARTKENRQAGNIAVTRKSMLRKCLFNLANVLEVKKCVVKMNKLNKDIKKELTKKQRINISNIIEELQNAKAVHPIQQNTKPVHPTEPSESATTKEYKSSGPDDKRNISRHFSPTSFK